MDGSGFDEVIRNVAVSRRFTLRALTGGFLGLAGTRMVREERLAGATAISIQEFPPLLPSGRPPDLAAMALSPEDVPAGQFDDYYEYWVPGDQVSELVLGGAEAPSGLVRSYQSFYFDPAEGSATHNFLFEFATSDDAVAGMGIVDAALRPPLPEGTTIGPNHAPGPEIGEEPRVTTSVTYDTWTAGGARVEVVAVSFRRENLIAGVAVERWIDPPQPGTPTDPPAIPVAPASTQGELAAELASTLDGRITRVLAGNSPDGTDFALPDLVLPLDQLTDGQTPVWGGYKSGIDLLRCGICGEKNSLLPFAEHALGGFTRGLAAGPLLDGAPQPPFVGVAVAAFDTPDSALEVLAAIRSTPNARPTPIPVPRGTRTAAEESEIPGALAGIAFQSTLDEENPDAINDSAGVDFVVGSWLITVDVLGGLPGEAALAAATDLAAQQAACLTGSGSCTELRRPRQLGQLTNIDATPASMGGS